MMCSPPALLGGRTAGDSQPPPWPAALLLAARQQGPQLFAALGRRPLKIARAGAIDAPRPLGALNPRGQ
eukprot:96930-Pyramimonas_sp.AAC.1